MKRKISKVEFEALTSADVKALYTADGDGYKLKLVDDDDPDELRRARDREKEASKAEKKRADELQTQLDSISDTDARKRGDIVALENSWKQKVADTKTELQTKIDGLTDKLKKVLVRDKATILATELAGDGADVLLPHIERRLQANLEGAEPSTRVLDLNGALSAASLDDLKKEFVANPKFSSIIIASKATGGAGSGRSTSAVPNGKKFGELSTQERVDWHKADPAGFNKASEEHRLSLRKM